MKTIRASNELERVTTPSLAALRKYVEGSRIADEENDSERGLALLEEAVQLDTSFAMAWRKISVLLTTGSGSARMIAAISTAYRHRERLTEMERQLTEGFYYTRGRRPIVRRRSPRTGPRQSSIPPVRPRSTMPPSCSGRWATTRPRSRCIAAWSSSSTPSGCLHQPADQQIANGRIASLDSRCSSIASDSRHAGLWEAEWYTAWAKGNIVRAESISRAVAAAPKSLRQTVRATSGVAGLSEYGGRLGQAREWQAKSSEALYRAQPTPANLLGIAMDSVYFELMYVSKAAGTATVQRALARVPIMSLAPSERPWYNLRNFGVIAKEPKWAREALAGADRDLIPLAADSQGVRASFTGAVAFAEGRYEDAIRDFTFSEQRFSTRPRMAALVRGLAYRELGRADSAIAAFEQFLAARDATGELDMQWRAPVLQYLGELYEAKGNRAKALERYGQFTEQWAKADPALQVRVREVRQRMAKLQGESG
jgi:tetratricopeptide (TPR) repeat protein